MGVCRGNDVVVLGTSVKPYGFHRPDPAEPLRHHKTAERMRTKRHLEDVVARTPPILTNGLLDVRRDAEIGWCDGMEMAAQVEDETALEVE